MSQDSIGVVTTGRGKLQEWKTTQKRNLSRKSRGTLTVKWAGSRDKIFSPSGRGRTFFLTSLFIELIEGNFWEIPCRAADSPFSGSGKARGASKWLCCAFRKPETGRDRQATGCRGDRRPLLPVCFCLDFPV